MPGLARPRSGVAGVDDEKVNSITVVGDAVAKPLMDAWDANPGRWDVSSLFASANGAAPLSPAMKTRIAATFPDKMIDRRLRLVRDRRPGQRAARAGHAGRGTGMAKFTAFADTCVVGDDREPVEPGSGVIGRVALTGHIPLGYHNDPERTAETFVEVDGRRHVITGDMATVEADGSIQLLGPWLAVHQHGRREGLPRRGRGGPARPPGGGRRAGGRRARRALGERGHRGGGPGARRRRRARGAARALPRHPGRLQAAEAPRGRRPHQALAGRQGQLPLGRADRPIRNWRGWQRIALVNAPISIGDGGERAPASTRSR